MIPLLVVVVARRGGVDVDRRQPDVGVALVLHVGGVREREQDGAVIAGDRPPLSLQLSQREVEVEVFGEVPLERHSVRPLPRARDPRRVIGILGRRSNGQTVLSSL